MTTTPTLRDAAQAITIITTPSGDYRWIAKDAAEVAHFSQPGQGHKIEVYTLAAPADALAEPVAWMVWWGIGHMHPSWPPYKTRAEAEDRASTIKSATEVRPLYAAPPATHLQQAVARAIEDMCARIKAADDAASEADYMLDSDDCIKVLRGEWQTDAVAIRAKGQQ